MSGLTVGAALVLLGCVLASLWLLARESNEEHTPPLVTFAVFFAASASTTGLAAAILALLRQALA